MDKYEFANGNSALGIDIPSVNVDIKVTSVKQPQSSCPFRTARQKIYGLGYHVIVFVYEKTDDNATRTGRLYMKHTMFVQMERTGDFQMTTGLRQILANKETKKIWSPSCRIRTCRSTISKPVTSRGSC